MAEPERIQQVLLSQDVPLLVDLADLEDVDCFDGHLLACVLLDGQEDLSIGSLAQISQYLVVIESGR